jgi:beta-glucosidase-like glycosyl hydrolase
MKKIEIEKKIDELLSQMTLEEKAGQLVQRGHSLVGTFDVSFEELLNMMFDGRISEKEFKRLMSTAKEDYHEDDLRAGRISSYNGVKDAETANYLQRIAVEETRLGIPLLFCYDVIHGYRSITPTPIAESCAWDEELWQQTARMSAREATAAGIHLTFAPMVDVAKDARWGRISEGAGEDSLLNCLYGAAKVRGFQGDDLSKPDSMAACVKHFAAYGAAESGRDYNRVEISEQRLHEEYLPPFRACVDAGARAIMPAFNDINGVPCTVNKVLLHDVLRKNWGFDGMLISDANAIAECVAHGIATDKKDAARQSLLAGLNMDMGSGSYAQDAVELVSNGVITMEQLNNMVREILRVKFELDLFDNPYQTSQEREKAEHVSLENREIARRAAEKSIVLLKNENVLPINRQVKLGLVGELLKNRNEMTGAWAIAAHEDDCISVLDALEARGIDYTYTDGHDEDALCSIAQNSDVLLLALGETKDQSGEAASRANIALPQEQQKLFEITLSLGKPVVVLLFNGRPLAIPQVKEKAQAIVECWHLGIEAGNAILDVLFGIVNPSGKLTTTFPASTGQCPMYYNHTNTGRPGGAAKFTSKYIDAPNEPVFQFGYGLSYTSFEYSNLNVQADNEALFVSVQVHNTGNVEGDEIVQCYTRDMVAQRVRPVKELKAFTRVNLKVGEQKDILLKIPYNKLGYYDAQMQFRVDDGIYQIQVGTEKIDFNLQKNFPIPFIQKIGD